MALKKANDILKGLGVDPDSKATISYAMWQPWQTGDKDHENDPQGFVGNFTGYKVASKKVASEKEGGGRPFDLFAFDACEPKPVDGSAGFVVSSSFMLEELKRVLPGTRIAIVWTGSERNAHGGSTHNLEWYFANPKDKAERVADRVLPPSNADKIRLLPAGSSVDDDTPF
jgi:hypothetical protein